MKKIAIWLISIVGLFILFLIYDFIVVIPTITVENVKLIEAKTFKEYERSNILHYAVNENDSRRLMENNTGLKEALITFKYDNEPFFKTFYEVRGVYAMPENLPPIIVGKKPDMASVELTNIYSRTHERRHNSHKFRMTVLIDPNNYSDIEILEMLKTVEVMITGYSQGKVNVLATLPLEK